MAAQIPEGRNINGEPCAHSSSQAALPRVLIDYVLTPDYKVKDTKLTEPEFDF